jgi:23S rRNA pseudouridine2457 synthase
VVKDYFFKLNKPPKYLSQFVRIQKRTKKLLGEIYDFPSGTMSVGRLDENSEGLLLLTTDGKESNRICQTGIEKEYFAQVDGEITREAIYALSNGVEIGLNGGKYITKVCKVRSILDLPYKEPGLKIREDRHGPTTWVSITITEGKFRQVRKMTAAVGFPTLRLIRWRIGNITLKDLKPGAVEQLTRFDA